MALPAMKLDTLTYANKLIEAGCDRKIAEAHAHAQQDTLIEFSDHLDLTLEPMKQDIATLKTDVSEIKTELMKLNSGMNGLDSRINGLSARMETLSAKLTLRMGAMMTAGFACLAILIKF